MLGLALVAARGLIVLPFGLVGVAGAIFYTVPPLRAAYRPFAGEAVAFVCLADCVIGAYVLQGGRASTRRCSRRRSPSLPTLSAC